MGEIFERPAPPEALAWTGERLTTAVSGAIEIEHLHRYFFARELCRGQDVLDVASGEGYGAALLAPIARTVTGVEIDPASVAHAARSYQRDNLAFVRGDARALPLGSASVDVVVSFETLEHLVEHELFLREVKRVLRPGGLLVLSTPDRDVYSPAGSPANPYHAKELTRAEFAELLGATFATLAIYAQRPIVGSLLLTEGGAAKVVSFERRGTGHYEASVGVPRAPYLVIVASDGELPEPVASAFFETDRVGELLDDAPERQHLISALERERAEYAARLSDAAARLQAAEEEARSALARADAAAADRSEAAEREASARLDVERLAAELSGLKVQLAAIETGREAARASLRAQAALLARLRHGAPAPPHRPPESVAWRVMRATAHRVLPRSTRTWLRQKFHGPY